MSYRGVCVWPTTDYEPHCVLDLLPACHSRSAIARRHFSKCVLSSSVLPTRPTEDRTASAVAALP